MQYCHYAGCKQLSTESYCPEHKTLHDTERKSLIQGGYSGKAYGYEWAKTSKRIRKREPVCRVCKVRAATAVDHIRPKAQGGTDNEINLQPICDGCLREKSIRDRSL